MARTGREPSGAGKVAPARVVVVAAAAAHLSAATHGAISEIRTHDDDGRPLSKAE